MEVLIYLIGTDHNYYLMRKLMSRLKVDKIGLEWEVKAGIELISIQSLIRKL